ncbi:protein kinase [Stieleria sp. TO1_6]|uniref:serine/threonine protein kinase n=1 Tax=Stieleria tagensis TaxID=2956795 RepID=UPI00209B088C|nr:protein kinase [Stieleria tagensis]MCO8123899.1 protein kinase [Stieleria tagensis]
MDADRYARVRDLFLAADEIGKDRQYEFVASQCGDDHELIAEVMSLLDEHDMELARIEGDSAKQPTIPPAATETLGGNEPSTGPAANDDPTAADGLQSAAASASPFLPSARPDVAADSARPRGPSDPLASQKRKRPLRREGQPPAGQSTAKGVAGGTAQVTQHGSQRTHASPRYESDSPRPRKPPSTGIWQTRAKRHRRFNSGWLWLAAILPTAMIGWWTYSKVVESMRKSTANELAGVVDSVRISVDRFLDDQSRLARSWSRQPELRSAVTGLIEAKAQDDSAESLRQSPHAAAIRSQLVSVSQLDEIKYVVWDRTGTIIASWLEDGADVGGNIAPDGAANLNRALRGETVLFGPEILRAEGNGFEPETDQPVMAEIMPVYDDRDRVIAAILIRGFGVYQDYDNLFRQASDSGGLDVYAVSRSGVMLTNSPAASSLIRQPASDDTDIESEDSAVACQLRVTDPGFLLGDTAIANSLRRTQPLTYAAAGASSGRSGSRLTPYRNYAGVPVVGAWRWVDDWDMGIVVERSTSSAFATANIVRFGFVSLGLMLSLTALIAAAQIAKRTALAQAAVHPLSRYKLITELGSGGMGVVYRAKHNQLGRDTALKVLRGDRDNIEDRLRFDREAKLAASLSSPHTVTIYDYGRSDEDEAYCVMEFLKGITLYDVVARSGFQHYGRVLFVLRQICDSLGEAHQLGLVHRDVKPQNVMLSLDASVGDWAVVFDFGLAKPLQPDADAYQTAETIWAGTPMYMAPERYREPNKIDPRSDIYSVGCIAYFLLAGRPPFIECDPESLFALVLTEQPISIGVHRDAEVPVEIADLVARCMAKSVDQRFATVDQLAAHLDALIPHYPWTVDDARTWWRIHGEDL